MLLTFNFHCRVSIRPIDGDAANLDVNYEQVDTTEHIATAFWDMNSHQSRLLTTVPDTSSSSTSLTPIEISFGETMMNNRERTSLVRALH